jgi:TRAP-type mannitol/chloroaromatic compound transport system substrate-binding protein
MHTVGWADAIKYYLTNPISGAWAGSYFVNSDKWAALPPHLQQLYKMMIDSSHYYRQHWYWAGEARYRIEGKLELTTIAPEEWKQVEDAARALWDEVATQSPRDAKVVEILKKYNDDMVKAGAPYRYG